MLQHGARVKKANGEDKSALSLNRWELEVTAVLLSICSVGENTQYPQKLKDLLALIIAEHR